MIQTLTALVIGGSLALATPVVAKEKVYCSNGIEIMTVIAESLQFEGKKSFFFPTKKKPTDEYMVCLIDRIPKATSDQYGFFPVAEGKYGKPGYELRKIE